MLKKMFVEIRLCNPIHMFLKDMSKLLKYAC